MQINSNVHFIVCGEKMRICSSCDGLSEYWVNLLPWRVEEREDVARDWMVSPWRDTSTNAHKWNEKMDRDDSLEVVHLRVMVGANLRTRSGGCYLE